MSIAHSDRDFLPDDNVFSGPDLYAQIVSASHWLSASEVKLLLRDTQHELTSAWKFYMGLGCNKQVLVLVDGFTSLPVSVARHCANVVVHGMQAEEAQFLHSLAIHKHISNYSCADALASLSTRFDLVVLAVAGTREKTGFPPGEELHRLVHPRTEFWVIATNEFSLGYAKALLRSFWSKLLVQKGEKTTGQSQGVHLQFGVRPPVLSRHAKRYLVALGCKPFAEIGFESSMVHMQTVRPAKHLGGRTLLGSLFSLWKRLRAGEMVIGAAVREDTEESFLGKLLKTLPNSELSEGSLQRYYVSAGGKVLLFANFQRYHLECKTLVKLPLNEHAQRRLAVNQAYLKFLESSSLISNANRKYFPEPLAEGSFEGQAFYAESILEGHSGDMVQVSSQKQQRIIQETFSFWTNIQKSLKRVCHFDSATFVDLIEIPLCRVFNSTGQMNNLMEALEKLRKYLRARFMHKEFILSLVHGDFSVKNIIFSKKDLTLSGIIDWDRACESAFPIFDVFHYFVRMQEESYHYSPVQVIFKIFETNRHINIFQNILDIYCKEFNIENDMITSFVIIYWIHLLSGFESLKFLNKSFVENSFNRPLELLIQRIS